MPKVNNLCALLEKDIRTQKDIPATSILGKACKFDNERYGLLETTLQEDLGHDVCSIVMSYHHNPLPILVAESKTRNFFVRCKKFTLYLVRFVKRAKENVSTITLRDFLEEGIAFWDEFLAQMSRIGMMIDENKDLSHQWFSLKDDIEHASLKRGELCLHLYRKNFLLDDFFNGLMRRRSWQWDQCKLVWQLRCSTPGYTKRILVEGRTFGEALYTYMEGLSAS